MVYMYHSFLIHSSADVNINFKNTVNRSAQGANTEFGMPSGQQVLEGLWCPQPCRRPRGRQPWGRHWGKISSQSNATVLVAQILFTTHMGGGGRLDSVWLLSFIPKTMCEHLTKIYDEMSAKVTPWGLRTQVYVSPREGGWLQPWN